MSYLDTVISALVIVANKVGQFFTMLKRRTSKRFVIGEGEEQPSWEKDEAESTAVIPTTFLQKFQMTLDVEPEKVEGTRTNDRSPDENVKLLRPPATTSTLQ